MACNAKKDKNELLRVVRDQEGNIHFDPKGKLQGRGAYICRDMNCLNKVMKSKRIDRTLEVQISDGVYEELRKEIEK